MSSDSRPINLTNHFLIAMPGLNDELFGRSVVFMCEHSERGALGLIINKPSDIRLSDLFDKVELSLQRTDLRDAPVFRGGPLQTERGFVLHEAMGDLQSMLPEPDADAPEGTTATRGDAGPGQGAAAQAREGDGAEDAAGETAEEAAGDRGAYASTLRIPGGLEMTTSRDVLEAMSIGAGPARVLVSLGYSSWGQGQLESEITENSWLTVPADPIVIFDTPVDQRYERAMALLGLQPWMLAPGAGHA